MSIGHIVVVKSAENKLYGKKLKRQPNGEFAGTQSNPPTLNYFFDVEIETLDDLAENIRKLQENPKLAFILYGRTTEYTRRQMDQRKGVRRFSKPEDATDDKPLTLDPVPSSLLAIDVDNYRVPDGAVYEEFGDIQAPLDTLPTYFHNVSFVRQWSGSAKLKDRAKLKAHWIFRLVDPQGNPKAVTCEWAKAFLKATAPRTEDGEILYDPGLYSRGRVLNTARPILEERDKDCDPYSAQERVKVIRHEHDAVVITPEIEALVEAQLQRDHKGNRSRGASRKLKGEAQKISRTRKRRSRRQSLGLSLRDMTLCELFPSVAGDLSGFEVVIEQLKRRCEGVDSGKYNIINKVVFNDAPMHIIRSEIGYMQALDCLCRVAQELRPHTDTTSCVERALGDGLSHFFTEFEVERDQQIQKIDQVPSTQEEIAEEVFDVMERAFCRVLTTPKTFGCVVLPTGAGKTHQALTRALEVAQTRPVIFALATNALADEKAEHAEEIRREREDKVDVTRWRSVTEKCTRLTHYPDAKQMKRAYGALGLTLNRKEGSFCELVQCPQIKGCHAEDLIGRDGLSNGLYIMTHAKLKSISEERLTKDTLIIYDEAQEVWFESKIALAELKKIIALEGSEYSALAQIAKKVDELIISEAKSRIVKLDELLSKHDLLIERALAKGLLEDEAFTFPTASKVEQLRVLEGGEATFTSETRAIMQSICKSLCGEKNTLKIITRTHTGKTEESLEMCATWEPRSVEGVPLSALVLDATPTPDIEILARAHGLDFETFTAREGSIKGFLNEGYYRAVSYVNKSNLFSEGKKIRGGHEKKIARVARCLKSKLEHLDDQAKIAVLTSEKFKDALLSGEEREYQEEGQEESITGVLSRFEHIKYGHYYADSRGSNEFENCDALILLGSLKLELTTAQVRHQELQERGCALSFDDYYGMVNQAEIDQAIGRGRSLRREVLTLVYGSIKPTQYEDDGMVWTTRALNTREKLKATQEARDYALKNALEGAHIKAKYLIPFGISERTRTRIIQELSLHEKLRVDKEGKSNVLRLHEDYSAELEERWEARRQMHNEARQEALVIQDQVMVTTDNIVQDLITRTQGEDMIFLSDALGELRLPPGVEEEVKRGIKAEEDEIGSTFTTTRVGDDLLIYKGRSRNKIEGYNSALLSIIIRWIDDQQGRDLPPHVQSRRYHLYRRLHNPRLEGVLRRVRYEIESRRQVHEFRSQMAM